MSDCWIYGCRSLETRCTQCGHLICTVTHHNEEIMANLEKLKAVFSETANFTDTISFLNNQQKLLKALAEYVIERDSKQNKGETQ